MSSFKPNESQKKVMECDENLCVIAGAGSGKTGTLIESIVSRLEESRKKNQSLSITDILALTFTEKAAAELKERLFSAFKMRRQNSLTEPEASYWREESSRLDRADIGTIHSYALKLVRENALLLGLSSAMEIENSEWHFQHDLNNIMVNWLDEGNEDFLDLCEFFSRRQLKDFLTFCARRLNTWGMINFSAASWPGDDCNIDLLIDNFKDEVKVAADFIDNGGIKADAKYYPQVQSAITALKASIDLKNADDGMRDAAIPRWGQLVQSSGDWHTVEGRKIKKSLKEAFERLWQKYSYDLSAPVKEKALRLTGQLLRQLSERKKKRGVLDFDDILMYARRLLAGRPEIRRREIKRHSLLMVDEFQDTNRLQANILSYLLLKENDETIYDEKDDLWSSLNWHEIGPRLHVFGDLKQSIYRFRGAEIKVMADFRNKLELGAGSVLALNTNYRTQNKLVDFFNAFFSPYLEHLFTGHDHQLAARPSIYQAAAVTLLKASYEPPTIALKAETQAHLATSYLNDLFAGKHNIFVPDGEGGTRVPIPGDVAILFRRFKYVNFFTEAIAARGWKYQISTSGNPSGYAEVRGLLSAFRYLCGFDMEASLVGALRSPLGPVSDAGLLELIYGGAEKINFFDYFNKNLPWPKNLCDDDKTVLEAMRNMFQELGVLAGRIKSADILEHIIEERNLLAMTMLHDDGPQRMKSVQNFLGLSRGLGRKRESNPLSDAEELTELWRQWQGEALEDQSSLDSIKIMTIHAAKGLEFPLVLVAEADRQARGGSISPVLSDDGRLSISFKADGLGIRPPDYDLIVAENDFLDEQEERRLFYVAATRARDHLVLMGWPSSKKTSGRQSWLDAVNSFDQEKKMSAWLEYDLDNINSHSSEKNTLCATAAIETFMPPLELLEPIYLKSESLSVTSLCAFLSNPEGFYRERFLGWEKNFRWKDAASFPFFPISKEKKSNKETSQLTASEAGTLFHSALEHLDFSSIQLKSVLAESARRLKLEPDKQEMDSLERKLSFFLNHPLGLTWQKSASQYRELPFWLQLPITSYNAELSLTGIIDLFYIDSSGNGQIVDYKLAKLATGYEMEVYEYQLRLYAQALRSAGFSGKIKAALYFADEGEGQAYELSFDENILQPVISKLNDHWPLLLKMRGS